MRDFDVTGSGFSRWVGIINKGAFATEKGLYLIAKVYRGNGHDIEYEILDMNQGDPFDDGSHGILTLKPIAYHFIPKDQWITTNLLIHKREWACIPAPITGIAVISLLDARLNQRSKVSYFLNEVKKFGDISTVFKWEDLAGPTCFSDDYDGFMIQSFHMVFYYDSDVCNKHVRLRLKNQPDFLK